MDPNFSRRTFFKIFAISLINYRSFASPQKNKKRFGKILTSTTHKKQINGSNFNFLVYDLDTSEIKKTSTSYLLHSFEKHPFKSNEVTTMAKWTPDFFIYDLNTLKIKKTIKSSGEDELFVGHGTYSPDGRLFYASVAIYEKDKPRTGAGFINIYETNTWNKISKISSEGFEPHMSFLSENGNELLVLNSGVGLESQFNEIGKKEKYAFIPSISSIDVNSGKLIKKIDLKKDDLSFSHLSGNKKGDLFFLGGKKTISNQWKPKAQKIDRNFQMTPLELEEPEIHDPMLSPKIDQDGKFAVATSPWSNKIFFWDFKSGKLIKKYEVEGPAGLDLTLDNSHFVALAKNKIVLFDSKDLDLKKTISLGKHEPRAHCLII